MKDLIDHLKTALDHIVGLEDSLSGKHPKDSIYYGEWFRDVEGIISNYESFNRR